MIGIFLGVGARTPRRHLFIADKPHQLQWSKRKSITAKVRTACNATWMWSSLSNGDSWSAFNATQLQFVYLFVLEKKFKKIPGIVKVSKNNLKIKPAAKLVDSNGVNCNNSENVAQKVRTCYFKQKMSFVFFLGECWYNCRLPTINRLRTYTFHYLLYELQHFLLNIKTIFKQSEKCVCLLFFKTKKKTKKKHMEIKPCSFSGNVSILKDNFELRIKSIYKKKNKKIKLQQHETIIHRTCQATVLHPFDLLLSMRHLVSM